jgi:hypothetical protein
MAAIPIRNLIIPPDFITPRGSIENGGDVAVTRLLTSCKHAAEVDDSSLVVARAIPRRYRAVAPAAL